MNLAAMAMRYRPVVITLVTLLTLWGCWTYVTIPRREDPEFTIRRCVVITPWPGASALKLEELVTEKLESALDGVQGVKELKSTTTEGLITDLRRTRQQRRGGRHSKLLGQNPRESRSRPDARSKNPADRQ